MSLFPYGKISRIYPLSISIFFLMLPACTPAKLSPGEIRVHVPSFAASAILNQAGGLLLIGSDPNIIFSELRMTQAYPDEAVLVGDFIKAAEEQLVARSEKGGKDWCSFRDIPAGHYWVISAEPVLIEEEHLLWAHPVRSGDPDWPPEIRLQRSNAAMVFK